VINWSKNECDRFADWSRKTDLFKSKRTLRAFVRIIIIMYTTRFVRSGRTYEFIIMCVRYLRIIVVIPVGDTYWTLGNAAAAIGERDGAAGTEMYKNVMTTITITRFIIYVRR